MSVSEPSPDSQYVQSNGEVDDSLNNSIGSPDNFKEFSEFSSRTQSTTTTKVNSALTFSILCDLLDECTIDVIFEAHREAKLATSKCQLCNVDKESFDDDKKNKIYVVAQPGLDIFGNHPQPNNSPTFECVNCQRPYPSQRYAPHLEKCMGLAGRSSSRVANLRMGNERNPSSPHTPLLSEDPSDSDGSLYTDKKRKKVNGKSRASSPAKYPKVKKQKSIQSDSVDTPNFISNSGAKKTSTSTRSASPAPSSMSDGQSPLRRPFMTQLSNLESNLNNNNFEHHQQQQEGDELNDGYESIIFQVD
ncbi:1330_t:CDS:2 [Diversispora eburnea]|uniref:SAGA-associated factor 11 n=1 Tax=Diversispora eburnea TaxID=1213867 RepID=A0A9N9B0P9_9GLOM|nr:1330_t:CDS:2 [Diversispora eburnea]